MTTANAPIPSDPVFVRQAAMENLIPHWIQDRDAVAAALSRAQQAKADLKAKQEILTRRESNMEHVAECHVSDCATCRAIARGEVDQPGPGSAGLKSLTMFPVDEPEDEPSGPPAAGYRLNSHCPESGCNGRLSHEERDDQNVVTGLVICGECGSVQPFDAAGTPIQYDEDAGMWEDEIEFAAGGSFEEEPPDAESDDPMPDPEPYEPIAEETDDLVAAVEAKESRKRRK